MGLQGFFANDFSPEGGGLADFFCPGGGNSDLSKKFSGGWPGMLTAEIDLCIKLRVLLGFCREV